jgi:hypothetical protein
MKRTLTTLAMLTFMVCVPPASFGQQLSEGNWLFNANGFKFVLNISTIDSQGHFIGTLRPLNSADPTTTVVGDVASNGRVVFSRTGGQTFDGFVFRGREQNRHMAGTFDQTAGWFAEFQFPASVPPGTPPPPSDGFRCTAPRSHCCDPLGDGSGLCMSAARCVDSRNLPRACSPQ